MTQSATVKRWMLSKRYESRAYGTQYEHMEQNPNGDYVRINDYHALAAQCAELQQYRAWAEPQIVQHGDDVQRIADLRAQLSACQARVEEAEKDARRIDWLIAIGGYRYVVTQIDGYYVAEIRCGFPKRLTSDLHQTPRAAIDAAMALGADGGVKPQEKQE